MAEDFKIADGYVAVAAKLDREAIDTDAEAAGERAGETFTRGVDGRLRDSRGRFARDIGGALGGDGARRASEDSGGSAARGFLYKFGDVFSSSFLNTLTFGIKGSGSLSEAFATNPEVAAVGAGLAAAIIGVALPAIGAGLTAGIGLLAGGGGIITGALLTAKSDPAVQKAASDLGNTIFGDLSKRADSAFRGPMLTSIGILKTGWTQISPAIGQVFQTLAPYLPPLVQSLVSFAEKAMPGFEKFISSVGGPTLAEFAKDAPKIGDAFSKFFDALSKGGPGATKFLADLINFFDGLLIETGYLLEGLSKAYSAIHDFFGHTVPDALKSAGKWFDDTKDKIEKFFTGLWDKASSTPGKVEKAFSDMKDKVDKKVSGWVTSTEDFFKALPGKVMKWLDELPGRMEKWALHLFDATFYQIGHDIGSVVKFFRDLPGNVVDAVSSLGSNLSKWATDAGTKMGSAVSTGIDKTVGFFEALPGRAGNAVGSLWTKLSGHFETAKINVNNSIRDATDSAVKWLSGLPGRAYTAISGLPGKVKSVASDAASWLYNAGKDVIRGLVNGIEDILGWAVDMAKRAAHDIAKGFKDALGIRSPSTLMRHEVGRQLLPGAVQGVEDTVPQAQRDLAGLARKAVAPMAPALSDPAPGGRSISIGNLVVQGVWDFTDPGAARAIVAKLREALAAYEKEYA